MKTMATHVRRVINATLDWWDLPFRYRLQREMGRPIPPISIRRRVAPLDEYLATTDEYIAYFKLLAGFNMRQRMLDIGCGHGRFVTRMLRKPHYFSGSYDGFDTDATAIRWAQRNIASPLAQVRFRHIDLHNGFYNPHGRVDPDSLAFPYAENTFNFVLAWSVFTHVRPDTVTRYLQEVHRVLKPGGCFMATCLMLDGYPNSLRSDLIFSRVVPWPSAHRWTHHDTWSTLYADAPERTIGLQRSFLLHASSQSRLTLTQHFPGSWSHDQGYLSLQDILVLQKSPAPVPIAGGLERRADTVQ